MNLTIDDLKDQNLILFETISGSNAYGLSTPSSDVDIKGVYMLPKDQFYSLDYIGQVSNESNDIVYYELGKFIELLAKSNPTALEVLYSPEDSIQQMEAPFQKLRSLNLLSKQCKDTFGGYAMTQVKKARGLKKKIVNPIDKERKGVLDFCFVPKGQGAIPLKEFLESQGLEQHQCGLSKISHMHEMYGLYVGERYAGIIKSEDSNDISLSSISKGIEPIALMSFNKSGYSKYCKEYKEYWDWVDKRNDARYENTLSHGKNDDAKNMMHTFRLLAMCEEIAREGRLNVRRPDREQLLAIKRGEREYEALLEEADNKIADIDLAYAESSLPDRPDVQLLNKCLIEMRSSYYG